MPCINSQCPSLYWIIQSRHMDRAEKVQSEQTDRQTLKYWPEEISSVPTSLILCVTPYNHAAWKRRHFGFPPNGYHPPATARGWGLILHPLLLQMLWQLSKHQRASSHLLCHDRANKLCYLCTAHHLSTHLSFLIFHCSCSKTMWDFIQASLAGVMNALLIQQHFISWNCYYAYTSL